MLNGGGYFWIAEGDDGHVLADEPGFVDYADGCAYDLRLPQDAPLAGMGAYAGPDAVVEDHDGDGEDTPLDCDDTNADVFSGADEVCNGVDDNCDAVVDEDAIDQGTWYVDEDGDGYGSDEVTACERPDGVADHPDDCDDTSAAVYPGADEVADDGVDQDCDGQDDVTPEPEPEGPPVIEAEGNWGCATAPAGGSLGLVLLLGLLVRRRSGPRARGCG